MSSNKSSKAVNDILPKLGAVIRASSGLASNDIKFYKSLDNSIDSSSNSTSDRILSLINELLDSVESNDIFSVETNTLTENWNVVSGILDNFLERSDVSFDKLRSQQSSESGQPGPRLTYLDDSTNFNANNSQKRQVKPQTLFKTSVDNSEKQPFKPLLKVKPHSILSFDECFKLTEETEDVPSHYEQPYKTEILKQEYNRSILEKSEPIPFKDWETTEAIWVDSIESLNSMLSELKKVSEIAVDLEHHDYRTYYGLVCLMQISTRDQDWIIDTLTLREELGILNEVFADSKITKVFHGAFMDIIWLQRDLGIYVVSLFDTYHASKKLGFPKHSLAYLLERFAHFKTSKKYQLADWRIRPLTKPMRAYARSDTHFLLYIFDQLKNMLLEKNSLGEVLFESRNVALRRFEYTKFRPKNSNNQSNTVSPIDKADPWKNLIYQYNLSPSRSKLVKALYEWRDTVAREEDESPRYVMSNQLLVSLASLAPVDSAGVLSSSTNITEHVRKSSKVVATIIQNCINEIEEEDLRLMNDAHDFYDSSKIHPTEITIENVETFEKIFTEHTENLKGEIKSSSFSESSKLFGRAIDAEQNFIRFSPNLEVSRTIDERLKRIQNGLQDFTNIAVPIPTHDIPIENKETKSEIHINELPEALEEAPQMFGDADDIIVLKTKKVQRNSIKDLSRSENNEAFDYSKANKVIKKQNFFEARKEEKKLDKKRSSDTFDPYSQIPDGGPRPAKKQQKLLAGKTMSYRSKK
ncbi:hypothetical protein WICMUC_002610 [Wickerhamomyces mucosus]|uniref:HRDC domain-containing protein n=1 Tax=Wickerhamomyces mucosus TaxID=1378264 RepID=A0A9P8PNX1_9ASCO|nr:hypothetical protein WICMUC_002610 [Wickerhamomyces mucosus]